MGNDENGDPCNRPIQAEFQNRDVSLKIVLAEGRTRFYVGEPIDLKLEFTSTVEGTYQLDTLDYDHIPGWINEDTFCEEPRIGKDPMAALAELSPTSQASLANSDPTLGSKPLSLSFILNDWRSLPPGKYRLRSRARIAKGQNDDRVTSLTESQPIEIEIVEAPAEWQAKRLREILTTLDAPGSDWNPEQEKAAESLLFMDSEDSLRELLRRTELLWEHTHNDREAYTRLQLLNRVFALLNSRHTSFIIRTMREMLRKPNFHPSDDFVSTLAMLETFQEIPGFYTPDGQVASPRVGRAADEFTAPKGSAREERDPTTTKRLTNVVEDMKVADTGEDVDVANRLSTRRRAVFKRKYDELKHQFGR
jgi:hypothetical protein